MFKVKYISELTFRPLSSDDLNFHFIPVGDSDELNTGDPITIIGFPGVGGYTPTLTTGVVSGFLADEGLIKTDAEISAGNSGGMAINQKGELIGVPTLKTTGTDYLGYIRPINLARDIIKSACPECLP
ncbi:MAG: serine protease [Anaerolineales bacterium]|nr:serine protease [Anaerolineales bacterium]